MAASASRAKTLAAAVCIIIGLSTAVWHLCPSLSAFASCRRQAVFAVSTGGLLSVSRKKVSAKVPGKQQVSYGVSAEQVGDLWIPDVKPRALVALLHGGFWQASYGKSLMDALAVDLSKRGMVAWNMEYRRIGSQNCKQPDAMLADVAAGLEAMRTKLNLPSGLPAVSVGHSAGGHLAYCLQLSNNPRSCVELAISLGGVLDLRYGVECEAGIGQNSIKQTFGQNTSSYKTFSPIDKLPPCLMNRLPVSHQVDLSLPLGHLALVHGSRDKIVPIEQSIRFFISAACAGLPMQFRQIKKEGHFEVLDPTSASWRATIDIIEETLVEPVTGGQKRGPLATTSRNETEKEVMLRTTLKK